jgi:ABC-type transport system involved in multi-copper enzyme maturation permease subunit
MPVFEQGYETYSGPRHLLSVRWWPLFREEVLPFLKKRRFLFLLFLALVPWFYGVLLTFFHTQLGDSEAAKAFIKELPVVDENLFAVLLTNGYDLFLLVIVLIWMGSGLVARDRKEGTLEVFLGRALTPLQYLWAKGAALAVFLLIFSLAPAVMLVVFQVGLTGQVSWLWEHHRVLWGTVLYTFVGTGSLVLFMLALSSLGRSPRLVGLTFFGIVFLGSSASGIVYAITRDTLAWLPSITVQLKVLARLCVGAELEEKLAVPALLNAGFFVFLAVGSLLLLYWRFARRGVLR